MFVKGEGENWPIASARQFRKESRGGGDGKNDK